jgi:hypothetical protein
MPADCEGYELVLSKVQSDLTAVERWAATCQRVQQAGALRQMCVGAKRTAELVVQSNLAASASKMAPPFIVSDARAETNVRRGTEAMLDAVARSVVPNSGSDHADRATSANIGYLP